MSLRRGPTELEQREHLEVRFGLIRRRDPGPAAVRIVRSAGLRRALEVPYYALLHHGNVVPRRAVLQRGPLRGSLAVRAGLEGMGAEQVAARAELIAGALMAEHDAPGAIYSVRARQWDPLRGEGVVEVDAASAAGGPVRAAVTGADLTPVLPLLLAAVLPGGALARGPIDLSDDPASTWRWTYPLRSAEVIEEFEDLHRRMSFAVLRSLTAVPRSELQPLKSVPAWYVDVPGAP